MFSWHAHVFAKVYKKSIPGGLRGVILDGFWWCWTPVGSVWSQLLFQGGVYGTDVAYMQYLLCLAGMPEIWELSKVMVKCCGWGGCNNQQTACWEQNTRILVAKKDNRIAKISLNSKLSRKMPHSLVAQGAGGFRVSWVGNLKQFAQYRTNRNDECSSSTNISAA